MPVTAYIVKGISVLLEYGILLFLLVFVARLSRLMFLDVRKQRKQISAARKAGQAALIVLQAGNTRLQGRRFSFHKEITIGRGPDNDIVIPENFVSHHHLVIYQHQNMYVIKDLGSRNRALVNGAPLNQTAYLRNGDQIQVGMVLMKFER